MGYSNETRYNTSSLRELLSQSIMWLEGIGTRPGSISVPYCHLRSQINIQCVKSLFPANSWRSILCLWLARGGIFENVRGAEDHCFTRGFATLAIRHHGIYCNQVNSTSR
jgi:hypothetical protein